MAVIMEIPYMDLDHIYMSKQSYTWYAISQGTYLIIHDNKAVKVSQKKNMFHFSCTEEEFYNVWYKYFDLDLPYDDIHYKYKLINGEFGSVCTRCSGLHILNQSLFQSIIESLIEAYVGVRNATSYIFKLCKLCGNKHKQSIGGTVTWYSFPNHHQVLKNSQALSMILDKCLEPVLSVCESISDGWLDLDLLSSLDYYEAKSYLLDFDYMTEEVVERICLLGLHIKSSIPLDKPCVQVVRDNFNSEFSDLMEWYLCETKYIETIGYLMYVLRYNYFCPPTYTNDSGTHAGGEKNRIYKKIKKLRRS